MNKKTILIYVNQGFAVRYLLRSDILNIIAGKVGRVIILSHNGDEDIFKKKFERENIIVEKARYEKYKAFFDSSKFLRLLVQFRSFILNGKYNTQTIDDFRKIFIQERGWTIENGFRKWMLGNFWNIFSIAFKKYRILRDFLVNLECKYFSPLYHKDLFKKYSPDLVVVSALCGFEYNEQIARESQAMGVPVCSVILSWDNTSGMGMAGYNPDYVVAWTENMKQELIELNDIDESKIYVGGVAHFDQYYNNDKILARNALCQELKLDPDKKIIFYATKSPKRFPWGPSLVADIAESIKSGVISQDTQILVRIHPLHYRTDNGKLLFKDILDEYDEVKSKYPSVILNKPKMSSKKIDFDLSDNESILVSSILKHSSVMLNMFSTMVIEAAIFDLPIINVCIQERCMADIGKSKQDIMVDYRQTHNQRVVQTGGAKTVFTNDELIIAIEDYLNNPNLDANARKTIVENEAGPFHGNAGKMIGNCITSLV